MPEQKKKPVGKVIHYYSKIGVAVVELSGKLKVGDEILIKGATTDLKQTIGSMQVEHEQVEEAKKGQAIGLKVDDRVKEGDQVFKVE